MKKIVINALKKVSQKVETYEYYKILNLSDLKNSQKELLVLDVGSGLCKFSNFLSKNTGNVKVNCLDINADLVELANRYGYTSKVGEITNLPYNDNQFDITHCSHVLEHLTYPEVIYAIDELVRVTKENGLIIIRGPLWVNHRFYNDIDHIMPYPPDAILNYFRMEQQQKKSNYSIKEVQRWYTKIYYEINPNRCTHKLFKYLNILFKLTWLYTSFPKERPNNYGLVLRKTGELNG